MTNPSFQTPISNHWPLPPPPSQQRTFFNLSWSKGTFRKIGSFRNGENSRCDCDNLTICHQLYLTWLSRKSNTGRWLQTIFDLVITLIFLKHLRPGGRAGLCQTHPGRHHDPKPGALRVPELYISSWPSATHLPTSSRVSSYHWSTLSKKWFLNFPSVSSHGEGREPISSMSAKPGPAVQT